MASFPTETGQALIDRQTLKSYFQYGDVPTEANYTTLLDKLATIVELNEEEDARIAADIVLQNQITSNDGELAALQTLVGADPTGDPLSTNLGDFTGDLLSDTSSVKVALQALESAVESNDVDIAAATVDRALIRTQFAAADTDLQNNINTEETTRENEDIRIEGLISSNDAELAALEAADATFLELIGLLAIASDLGTFAGSTIDDGKSVKGALQQLETAHETLDTLVDTHEATNLSARNDLSNLITTNTQNNTTQTTQISALDTRMTTAEAKLITVRLDSFIIGCSAETGAIATGKVVNLRMPYQFMLSNVRASVNVAPSGAPLDLIVKVDGTAVTNTISIPVGATTTGVNTTGNMIGGGETQVATDAEVSVHVSAHSAAEGLKVTLVGLEGDCSIQMNATSQGFPIHFPISFSTPQIVCS